MLVKDKQGIGNYLCAIKTGNGRIGASFREFPAESRDLVEHLAGRLKRTGLGGPMKIGRQGQALLDIPVNEGRVGASRVISTRSHTPFSS